MGTALIVIGVVVVLIWAGRFVSRSGWENQVPAIPRFAREKPPSESLRTTLRRDGNASIEQDTWSYLWSSARRYWFMGTGCPPHKLTEEEFNRLNEERTNSPVMVATAGDRQFWWWEDAFYWDNGEYAPADVRAIVLQNERRNRKQLQHAHDLMVLDESGVVRKREPIPEEVKRFVWRRDEGRCQKCGSQELLQYDHIIPLDMGGSNEPENLQLLCAPCNREKGATI